MRLTIRSTGCYAAFATCLMMGGPTAAQPQTHWSVVDFARGPDVTGTVQAPFNASGLPDAGEQMPPELVQAQSDPQKTSPVAAPTQQVDETALRFFASRGDKRRLEIEIARLKALYPDWDPPADPLVVPPAVDERLEAIWQLYAEGKYAEARREIAARQTAEADWQPPADLLDRLALAEARERLVNASGIEQFETVIRIASENPHLLTCSEVDVLWRVAEAFARTGREVRARDAYSYILSRCDDPQERAATVQNASRLLPRPIVDELLAMERTGSDGKGEFESVRDDLVRDDVARGGEDAGAQVPGEQIRRVERLAREEGDAADARLLGWYRLLRDEHEAAEEWFRRAMETDPSADAAQGLGLAMIGQSEYAEAEDVTYPWREASDDNRKVYLAAAANVLGIEPRVALSAEILGGIVGEAAAARDVPTARQLGWYSRGYGQHQTAGQWFATALDWDPDDEPSAYGLALTRHQLGDAAGLAEIKRVWSGRSDRIQQVGASATEPAPARQVPTPPTPAAKPRADDAGTYPPVDQATAPDPSVSDASQSVVAAPAYAPVRQREAATGAVSRTGCSGSARISGLSPAAALTQGWCLLEADRPHAAAQAFEVALSSSSEATRRDAGYGQSLAYMRAGLVDEAAVSAAKAPQSGARASELQASILAERAISAFDRGRYVEALNALDQRNLIASERIDLMVLRGYAYLNLRRLGDARRVFEAAAGTGSREGLRGLAAVRDSQRRQ